MVFSSHLFLFYFLPAALVLYYLSPRWLKQDHLEEDHVDHGRVLVGDRGHDHARVQSVHLLHFLMAALPS